jgi:hypothetical protein
LFALLFSPYRGLFYGSPFLAFGVAGTYRMLLEKRSRSEALLFAAIVAFFVLFNASFNAWHGGSGTGPRYLVPAIPFLALPAVFAFSNQRIAACALATYSVATMSLATAVDPWAPIGNRFYALYPGRHLERYDPLFDYHIPLFIDASPAVLRNAGIEAALARYAARAKATGESQPRISETIADMRQRLRALGSDIPPSVVPIAAFRGPVSVNPLGAFEGMLFVLSPPGSALATWNAFNCGEWVFPQSRFSLAPLGVVVLLVWAMAWRRCRRVDRSL